MYGILKNGSVQIISDELIVWDANHYCKPSALTDEEKMTFSVVSIEETLSPQYDRMTQNCSGQGAELVNGSWQQVWTVSQAAPADVQARGELIAQQHLDAQAQAAGYDNIISACSYASAPNPYQTEGISFVKWRGECWVACYALMQEVQAGTREMPTVGELLAALPVRS
jgi:hypothetical protein